MFQRAPKLGVGTFYPGDRISLGLTGFKHGFQALALGRFIIGIECIRDVFYSEVKSASFQAGVGTFYPGDRMSLGPHVLS